MFESCCRLPIYVAAFGVLPGCRQGSVICTLAQYVQVPGKWSAWKHLHAEIQRLIFTELQVILDQFASPSVSNVAEM